MDKAAEPEAYTALRQGPQNPLTFVVRSNLDAGAVIAAARDQVRTVDRDLALTEVTTLEAVVDESLGYRRFQTTLLSAFAAVAALLAGLGIYGVLAYFVSQRSREIGIRLALGARASDVLRMVVLQGMRPALVGMAVGLAAALALGRVLSSLIFGVRATDPGTFAAVAVLLAAVALAACLIPARRAARVSPTTALRDE
jgi:putative ABC transport system permease protein